MSVTVSRTVINAGSAGARGAPGVDGDDGLLSAASEAESIVGLGPGLGDSEKAVTPLGLGAFAEEMGQMMHIIRALRPTTTKPFAAVRTSKDRWWVATFVKDGNRMDYAIHEFVNHGPRQTPALTWAWRYNGIVYCTIDGIVEDFANFSAEDETSVAPIWEAGVRIGPHASWPTGFDYVTIGHGHLYNPGNGIFLNGGGTNYRDAANAPIGVILRGTAFTFSQTFGAYLPDNTTVAGTWAIAHVMVTGGVQIASTFTCTGTTIGITTAMGMGLSGRGDMLKPAGVTAIAADREDGLEYGAGGVQDTSLGEVTTFQLYPATRDTHILEAVLGGGGPMQMNGGGYNWSQNVVGVRDSYLQDRVEGYAKVYAHGLNRNDSMLLSNGDVLNFNVTYRVRKGALV